VYGDLIVDRFNLGTHFREWCLQIGFPPPPAEAQLMQASLSFLSQDKRQQVIEHLHTVRREHSGETDEDVEAAREHLQTGLAAVLEPDEMRLMALD